MWRHALVVVAIWACGTGCRQLLGLDDRPQDAVGEPDSAIDPDANVDDLDPDHDGVLTPDDNCPNIANPDQADEDADGLGDACDPCPPFADNTDGDGDGVGDLCDPNPITPGDTILGFAGFNAQPPDVELIGSWTFDNGVAATTSGTNVVSAVTWAEPNRPVTIMTKVTIDQLIGTGNIRAAGTMADFDTSIPHGIECAPAFDGGNTGGLYLVDINTSEGVLSAATPTAGQTYLISHTRTAQDFICQSDLVSNKLGHTFPFVATAPRIGIRTRSVAARFAWVLIVGS